MEMIKKPRRTWKILFSGMRKSVANHHVQTINCMTSNTMRIWHMLDPNSTHGEDSQPEHLSGTPVTEFNLHGTNQILYVLLKSKPDKKRATRFRATLEVIVFDMLLLVL